LNDMVEDYYDFIEVSETEEEPWLFNQI
jgi:hypothetical protein